MRIKNQSDVSKEYLLLYNNHVLEAEELNNIRLNGLRSISSAEAREVKR